MAKTRYMNTKFWSDSWVRTINPLDRYLFIYLLTNEHTNILGIYELPDDLMAFECGLSPKDIHDAFLPRLFPKVDHFEGWVIIPNFPKHQNLNSPDVVKGMRREFEALPEKIQKYALEIRWGEGLGIVPTPPTVLNSTKPNLKGDLSKDKSSLPILEVNENKSPARTHSLEQKLALRLRAEFYNKIATEYGVTPVTSQGDYQRVLVAIKAGLKESDLRDMMDDALSKGEGRTVTNVFTNRKIDLYRQENL